METPTQPLTIVFLGKAGAGKGTQAHLLAQQLQVRTIGSGEMLRAFALEGTPASKRLGETITSGKLAPTWLVSFLWIREVLGAPTDAHLLFDGSPRMLPEAVLLDDVFSWAGREEPKVILIDVPDDEAVRRLLSRRTCSACKHIYLGDAPEVSTNTCSRCGGALMQRSDDTTEAIQKRLAYFKTDVEPVVAHYEAKGWLTRINGVRTPDAIAKDIRGILGLSA